VEITTTGPIFRQACNDQFGWVVSVATVLKSLWLLTPVQGTGPRIGHQFSDLFLGEKPWGDIPETVGDLKLPWSSLILVQGSENK